ncbi:hypothetical protein JFL47_11620 [Haemophilus haemoglobinophilus]|nr:hypothetical protein [Canicola haemoglobinophilus]MBN6711863.1 hypothetical protein [Canicola haemoglobinophilus]
MNRISILDFFKTGKFGYVELGFSKSQVISFIGKNTKIYYCISGEILKYGDMEFHFSDDELVMIFCDSLKFLYGDLNLGKEIDFEPWIFKKNKIYSFKQIQEELEKENIIFIIKESNNSIEILLESGVKFIFENESTLDLKFANAILVGFEFSIF